VGFPETERNISFGHIHEAWSDSEYIVPHFLLHISSFVSLRRACDEDKQGEQRVNDSEMPKTASIQFKRKEEKIIK